MPVHHSLPTIAGVPPQRITEQGVDEEGCVPTYVLLGERGGRRRRRGGGGNVKFVSYVVSTYMHVYAVSPHPHNSIIVL